MSFYSYEGVSDDVLDKVHTTSTGETYTLSHYQSLKVEMQNHGKGNSNANSQGWERNSAKYFDSLYQSHPEMFSKKNAARVKEGHAPVVDAKMIAHNPGWEQYRNQPLVHHHIGGDGEAVAVPKNAHKGQGEIHNHEKAAGITDNCKSFSKTCGSQADSVGKTTSQLHSQYDSNKNSGSTQKSRTQTSNSASNKGTAVKSGSREAAVRDSVQTNSNTSSLNERSDAVRTATSSSNSRTTGDRSDAVKSSLHSGASSGHGHGSSSNTSSHSASASSSGSSGQSSSGSSSHGSSSSGNSQSK